MSLSSLVFTISLVSNLPPTSANAWRFSGDIDGVFDPVAFWVSDSAAYLVIFYSLDPEDLEGEYQLRLRGEGVDTVLRRSLPENPIYFVDQVELLVGPGSRKFQLEVRSGKKKAKAEVLLDLEPPGQLGASGILFASRFYEDPSQAPLAKDGLGFAPNPARAFWGDTLYYALEVYSTADTGNLVAAAGVLDSQQVQVLSTKPRVVRKRGRATLISGKIPLDRLPEGEYLLKVRVVDLSLGKEISAEKPFAKRSRAEAVYVDPILAFIDYLASPDELREFKALKTPQEKVKFLKRFWAKFPSGFVQEFKKRVLEADEKFSLPYQKGRYTDMGRIYIKFGPPDEVQREESPQGGKAYIRWVYYSGNREFLFADPNNTGEYQLIYSTDPSETPTLYYDKPPDIIDPRTEEWFWQW